MRVCATLLFALSCVQSVSAAPAPYSAELLYDDDFPTSGASGIDWADDEARDIDGSGKVDSSGDGRLWTQDSVVSNFSWYGYDDYWEAVDYI